MTESGIPDSWIHIGSDGELHLYAETLPNGFNVSPPAVLYNDMSGVVSEPQPLQVWFKWGNFTAPEDVKGGPGSGHRGHRGRPGRRGGSIPGKRISKEPSPEPSSTDIPFDEEAYFRERRRKAIREAEEEVLITPYREEAVTVLNDGTSLLTITGGTDYVEFTNRDLAMTYDATVIHDHPSGLSFSIEDIAMAVKYNVAEIIVVTNAAHDQPEEKAFRRFTMRRPSGGWHIPGHADERMNYLTLVSKRIDKDLLSEYWPMIKAGKITGRQAEFEHSVRHSQAMADTLGAEFLFEEERR